MSEKKWGITLIVTSAVLITAISLLFFSLKAPDMGVTGQWAIRIFAIAACAVQFIVFILFARAFKKNRKY